MCPNMQEINDTTNQNANKIEHELIRTRIHVQQPSYAPCGATLCCFAKVAPSPCWPSAGRRVPLAGSVSITARFGCGSDCPAPVFASCCVGVDETLDDEMACTGMLRLFATVFINFVKTSCPTWLMVGSWSKVIHCKFICS